MSTNSDKVRHIELTRTGKGRYKATNGRGGVVVVGSAGDPDFSPTELLLTAIAGCSAIDIDFITGKRAEPIGFDVAAEGVAVKDDTGNRLTGIRVTFDVVFPEGEDGDRARKMLPTALAMSRDRLCTVGRTVKLGEPIEYSSRVSPR